MDNEYQNFTEYGEDVGEVINELINDKLKVLTTSFLAKIISINGNKVSITPIFKTNAKDESVIINNCLVCYPSSQNWQVQYKLKVGDIGVALAIQNDISTYKASGSGGVTQTQRFKDLNDSVFLPLSLFNSLKNDDINYIIKSSNNKCLFEFTNDFNNDLKAVNITETAEQTHTRNAQDISDNAQNSIMQTATSTSNTSSASYTITTPSFSVSGGGASVSVGDSVSVAGGGTSLKAVFDSLADLIESLAGGTTSDGATTAPSSVGKFTAWKQELAKVLS